MINDGDNEMETQPTFDHLIGNFYGPLIVRMADRKDEDRCTKCNVRFCSRPGTNISASYWLVFRTVQNLIPHLRLAMQKMDRITAIAMLFLLKSGDVY